MRVLITGVTGFVGGHLAEFLASADPAPALIGMRRWRSPTTDIAHLLPRIELLEGDLLDASSIVRVVAASRPDVIFHLAASSSVAASWETPNEVLQINATGTLHLLEALRQLELDAMVVLACSAEAYGDVRANELPIGEEQPFRPLSPYAVSKATVDLLGYQYWRTFGLRTVRLRLFNHAGPRQAERFVISGLTRQVAAIEAGQAPARLAVGNLAARRDFVDVRDVARAYWAAATHAQAGEVYNVCTGVARSVGDVVERLLAKARTTIEVVEDPKRLRPAEIPVLQGDPTRLQTATGWRPEMSFERTLTDTLEHWRREIGGPG
jgi:GDP-4-dehydro-6-deoxy-D-mannose reductase